jgi:hypothetical protein
MDVARVCLVSRLELRNWLGAVACGHAMNTAAISIFHGGGLEPDGLRTLGYPNLPSALIELASRLYRIPEAVAYAAHWARQPLAAVDVIETLTSVVLEMRMNAPGRGRLEKRDAQGRLNWGEMEEYAERRRRIRESARPVGSGRMTPDDLRVMRETHLLQLAALSATGDPLEQFYFNHADEHALLAAMLSGRTLLYVLAGPGSHGGVAIRLTPGGQPGRLADSAFLPALQATDVASRLDRIRAGFKQPIMTRRRHAELARSVRSVLDWTGASAWGGMLDTWPDLLSTPLLVVGVGSAGLLPLYTASVNGAPVCTQADVIMAPSARSVHLASVLPAARAGGPVVVAADPWQGVDRLKTVKEEAGIVAAIHGVKEVLYGTGTTASSCSEEEVPPSQEPPRSRAVDELRGLLGEASLVHLACHGTAAGPALLFDGNKVLLNELVGGDIAAVFSGRPLIVLSACELGGFTSDLIPGEHFGFPAGLMAMGARAVIGALWPVPDSQDSVSLMRDFHQRLLSNPSPVALSEAIGAAEGQGMDPTAWGSFTHFGL